MISNINCSTHFPQVRLRRLREQYQLRRLIRETNLSLDNMILPIFVKAGIKEKCMIKTMPGYYQFALCELKQQAREIYKLGIPAILLFGIPEKKDAKASDSFSDQGIVQQAIMEIKSATPKLIIISDICCCEYTNHGHCGFISPHSQTGHIDNDNTLELLQQQVISHAKAGSDIMAPSGMIDGMVVAIRQALDQYGFNMTPILSYSAKYASCFYGPFRDAGEGVPQFGDRSYHQLDPANRNEALREVALDIAEGTDMIMVKPALAYLDVIALVKQTYPQVPLGAYQVSAEYAMIKAAAKQAYIDERLAVMETLTAIKRSGADFIISYFTKAIAKWL